MGIFRVMLALAVVAAHTHGWGVLHPVSGLIAVRIFFVISGFYMALILNVKYRGTILFYQNRFLRLYPAYGTVLALTMLWWLLLWQATGHRPPPAWTGRAADQMPWFAWLAIKASNLTMVGLDVPFLFHWKDGAGFEILRGTAGSTPDGGEWAARLVWIEQAWSIGMEIWFYMLAPFIVRRPIWLQALLAAISATILIASASPLIWFFFPANLCFFLMGSILYRLQRRWTIPPNPKWRNLVTGAMIIMILFGGYLKSLSFLAILSGLLVLMIPILFNGYKAHRFDNFIGNLSYPIYLVHLLVKGVMVTVLHIDAGLAIATTSVALSLIFLLAVDMPIDRWRQKRVERSLATQNPTPTGNVTAASP